MDDRARLLQIIRERSYEEREVTLVSGRKSNFYIDGKQTTLDPEGAYLVGRIFYEMIKGQSEAIGGPTLGADPIVTAVALTSHQEGNPIAAFIIRKEPKGHGKGLWIEGDKAVKKGARVAIVEDVVTTGGSLLKAIKIAEEHGLKVVQALTLVDREEGGKEELAAAGYTLEAVFTRGEIIGK
ncbi:MAG: orotate phosphoribosyltransferase [Deltaproteobacteria bacterium RBG_16_54_18]|nr:MAG: orotate phosphoribosyltransferase [Deltaproteobacteria bacterium RBG_16_54_18]